MLLFFELWTLPSCFRMNVLFQLMSLFKKKQTNAVNLLT